MIKNGEFKMSLEIVQEPLVANRIRISMLFITCTDKF